MPGGHVARIQLISHPQGRGSCRRTARQGSRNRRLWPAPRALTNAKVRRAMRATFGPVAVVLLFMLSICGCKSGSNMFASWGKKKPSSALSEAPPYKPSNPALPSAGQTPPAIAARTPATRATTGGTMSGATNNAYSSMAAGYQQSPYPSTGLSLPKVGNESAATATSATASAGPAPASQPVGMGTPNPGYASAVGMGNALPPAPAYKPAATATASSSQPQNGFYNPAYGGTGSTTPPTAYATAAAANPAYNYNSATASSAAASATPAASPAGQGSEIRVADVRAATSTPPAAQVAMVGTAPPATVTNNSASTAGATESNIVGDRYSNFAATSAAPAASAQPVVGASVGAPATGQRSRQQTIIIALPQARPSRAAVPALHPKRARIQHRLRILHRPIRRCGKIPVIGRAAPAIMRPAATCCVPIPLVQKAAARNPARS